METIAKALERFNEYMRAEFLEWHIDFLMKMEKMEPGVAEFQETRSIS
jgi:Uri superfamily endonuclease